MSVHPPPQGRLRVSIDSRLDQVFMVGYAVRGICTQLGMDRIVAFRLELAVVEAVNNAIKHAYDGQAGRDVEVIVTVDGDEVVFEICDEGKPLDLSCRPRLDYDPRCKQNLPEGGMGLHIISRVMDEITYCRREGRNCLTLRHRRRPPPDP
ncbi:MAG TPA: ATP-binding protein [Syntrophales bacterium]|nr:ATP-binding protein [Syntrophales bacterium]HON23929.1 ATP-binding protein [Syntrophales bacterium]HOU77753.1 ATP-binding protein [Syntrophales bacterium]HPC32852.1 ATP-binding protein [Syntrophales bacterium]HQG34884.1 ATP-binding protein [Syntrophales bacterium]